MEKNLPDLIGVGESVLSDKKYRGYWFAEWILHRFLLLKNLGANASILLGPKMPDGHSLSLLEYMGLAAIV